MVQRIIKSLTREEKIGIIREQWKSMTEEERRLVLSMIAELSKTGRSELLETLNSSIYKEKKVTIEQFLDDPYYLGATGKILYKQLRKDIIDFVKGGYSELIFTGAIGYGKTFGASVILVWKLYELLIMNNPRRVFKLSDDTDIYLAVISVTKDLAIKGIFRDISNMIRNSPFFMKKYTPALFKEEIRFPGNIYLIPRATNDTSLLGLAVYAAIIDEANFYKRKNVMDKGMAEAIYNSIRRRLESRFLHKNQRFGAILLCSSAGDEDSFVAQHIKEVKNDRDVFIRDYALWDVKQTSYSNNFFYVYVGADGSIAKIIDESELDNYEKDQIIKVPWEFRKTFEKDIYGALRDIAGINISRSVQFFENKQKIKEAFDAGKNIIVLVNKTEIESDSLIDYNLDYFSKRGKEYIVKVDPDAERYIHVDPSYKNDRTGFAMAHICDVVRKYNAKLDIYEELPVFYIDALFTVVPEKNSGIISFEYIRKIIYAMAESGINITTVTMDTFQSVDSLQQLGRYFNVSFLSADSDKKIYPYFKNVIYENRLKCPYNELLYRELVKLEYYPAKNKVDHPKNSSKDLSDAVACVVYNLGQNFKGGVMRSPILFGRNFNRPFLNTDMIVFDGKEKDDDKDWDIPIIFK